MFSNILRKVEVRFVLLRFDEVRYIMLAFYDVYFARCTIK
jgi:hypothetical protein